MNLDLTGKLALVTGSTRGIGLATATGLAQMGAEVIVNGRESAAVTDAIAKIKEAAPSAKIMRRCSISAAPRDAALLSLNFPKSNSRQQPRHLRTQGFFRYRGRRLGQDVRSQRDERDTPHATLFEAILDDKAWGRVVFVSSESADLRSEGDGALRFFESSPAFIARGAAEQTKEPMSRSIRSCRAPPGSRWRRFVLPHAPREWESARMNSPRAPSPNAGPPRCCNATPCRRRSRT